MLAIIESLKGWRHWTMETSIPVKILTDHNNLKYFMTSKELNRRQVRWAQFLSDYNFELIHQPGKDNLIADALLGTKTPLVFDHSGCASHTWENSNKLVAAVKVGNHNIPAVIEIIIPNNYSLVPDQNGSLSSRTAPTLEEEVSASMSFGDYVQVDSAVSTSSTDLSQRPRVRCHHQW